MKLESVSEVAEKFHLSKRRVQKLCEEGRILGAKRVSGVWIIPSTAKKPIDERYSTPLTKGMNLKELCSVLSISLATGRNWIKLGKLHPTGYLKGSPYFSPATVLKIKKEMASKENTKLKRRRNKSHQTGYQIERSYVRSTSCNLPIVEKIFHIIEQENIKLDDTLSIALILDVALQFLSIQRKDIPSSLKDYIKQDVSFFLIEELLPNKDKVLEKLDAYPALFSFTYTYEEGEDLLGLLYISFTDLHQRKKMGAYYTPTTLVQKLCHQLFSMNSTVDKTILDPSCGTGNFLLQLPASIPKEQVYGIEIDPISVGIARINYALKYHTENQELITSHILCGNYLTDLENQTFDYIIGNPPWGYAFSEEEKEVYKKNFTCVQGNMMESYDLFVEQSIRHLNVHGVFSFLLPVAFLQIKTHTPIREFLFQNCSIQYLSYLGNVFENVQCPCIILQSIYTKEKLTTKGMLVEKGKKSFTITNNRDVFPSAFSFHTTDLEEDLLLQIENISPKVTLEGHAKFALGIVTGNNQKYISSKKTRNNEVVLRGSDLTPYYTKPGKNFLVFEPEKFQQVADLQLYRAEEKLLYRFISKQLVFSYDKEKRLSLNSANILIPQMEGLSIKYILAILNSRIVQFYFQKKFASVKVLRSHIEQIPIPTPTPSEQKKIVLFVDKLLNDPSHFNTIYEQLEENIQTLYHIKKTDYQKMISALEETIFPDS